MQVRLLLKIPTSFNRNGDGIAAIQGWPMDSHPDCWMHGPRWTACQRLPRVALAAAVTAAARLIPHLHPGSTTIRLALAVHRFGLRSWHHLADRTTIRDAHHAQCTLGRRTCPGPIPVGT